MQVSCIHVFAIQNSLRRDNLTSSHPSPFSKLENKHMYLFEEAYIYVCVCVYV